MYSVTRIQAKDVKGLNYIKPTVEALTLSDRLKGANIDLKDSKVIKCIISLIPIEDLLNDARINNIVAWRVKRDKAHRSLNAILKMYYLLFIQVL